MLIISDGAGITWYEPPPIETITNEAEFRTVDRNLTDGFMNKLTWNFSLPAGSSVLTVTIKFNSDTTIGTYVQSLGTVTITEALKNRFNFTWIPSKATLTIFSVTSDDSGEFACDVLSFDGSGTPTWKRKIQVTVLGKLGNYQLKNPFNSCSLMLFIHNFFITFKNLKKTFSSKHECWILLTILGTYKAQHLQSLQACSH